MPEVQIPDDRKYERALGLLYRMGGLFRTKPTHMLVVGDTQLRALVDAGLVEPNGMEARKRGQQKKKV
jgi:hypothetical protein